MSRTPSQAGLLATILIVLTAGAAPRASAGDGAVGPIVARQAWTRATPGGSTIAAGYLVLRNTGDKPDRLMAVTVEGAAKASPHAMATDKGVMTMRPITGGVVVPAHGEAAFRPGGDHLMFEGLKHPLKDGDRLAATLTFESAGTMPLLFDVRAIGAPAPGAEGAPMPKAMKMD